jgi:putative aldouronate transport system permease protein
MKTFFENLPDGLEEAARIDGANDFQVLWHVVLPLSRPILLTIGLFYLVGHWNEFFQPLIFLTDSDKTTLPVLLHKILQGVSMSELVEANVVSVTSPQALRMAAVIITMIPMLLVYPWIQRHFIHGVLIGGIKE